MGLSHCRQFVKEVYTMKEMIGYCGYNCHLCAARSDDPVIRQKMVDGWKKNLGA